MRQRFESVCRFVLAGTALAITATITSDLYACGVVAPSKVQLYSSYTTGVSGSYTTEEPAFQITGCDLKSRGKYIMLGIGPDLINLDYFRSNAYAGVFIDDYCKVENATNLAQAQPTYEQKLNYYRAQTTLLNSCVEAIVTDESRTGIVVPQEQDGCIITKIEGDRNSVIARGGYCYFRINPDSNMHVKYRVRSECHDRDFLVRNKLNPLDINFAINTYVSGDASGHSTDLTHLSLTDGRYTLEPEDRMLPLSTNYGTGSPRWPSRLAADFHFGNITISGKNDPPSIKTNFLVDNRCKPGCVDGLCASVCDYSVPAAAEAGLYEYKNGRLRMLDFWYQGAIAPPQWFGFVPGEERQLGINPFQVGAKFRMVYKFAFPDSYYRLAKEGFGQFLIKLIYLKSAEIGVDTLPGLGSLRGLRAMYSQMPGTQPLPPLTSNARQLNTTYAEPLATLASYLDFEGWPPFYEQICSPDQEKCLAPYRDVGQTVISVDFTIAGRNIETGDFTLKDLRVLRQSDVLSTYSTESAEERLPQVACKPPEQLPESPGPLPVPVPLPKL